MFLGRSMHPPLQWTNWTGFMETIFRRGDQSQPHVVEILPLIDLDPNDETTLYSAICFVHDQVMRTGGPGVTSLTFDQPLYIKAMEIVLSKNLIHVVLPRLGGFHYIMSAIGSLFATMKGAGCSEACEQIYATNSVPTILNGHAIARALRFIHLIDAALNVKLLESMSNDSIVSMEDLERLQQSMTSMNSSMEAVLNSEELLRIDNQMREFKENLCEYRTPKLWLQFQNYIDIVHQFIAAERLKDFEGHLSACTAFLNLFAATGHHHYGKSGRLYIQTMRNLQFTHPVLYDLYMTGEHAVQRSQHPFNGLWTDLVIEQVFMASLKRRGGLTHGRGLTDSVRAQWIYSLHHRASIHEAMMNLTGKRNRTSDQHADLGTSRRARDAADVSTLVEFFTENGPFDTSSPELRSISSGLTATTEDKVNCDDVETIGAHLQEAMDGVAFKDAKIKRSRGIKTLQDLVPGIKIDSKVIHVDPTVLFHRCIEVARRLGQPLDTYFEYEMTSTPRALFGDFFMRKTDKSELANKIKSRITPCDENMSAHRVVIDGGWLINKVRWKKKSRFTDIFDQYCRYVHGKFPSYPVSIVFDGYRQNTTKDHEHLRRMEGGKKAANLAIKLESVCLCDQQSLLRNAANKQLFIDELTMKLRSSGHEVIRCSADADTTVVKTAIVAAKAGRSAQVVAEDADILFLLIAHWDQSFAPIFFRQPGRQRRPDQMYKISDAVEVLHPHQAKYLLFIHAWSGCDTTSSSKPGKITLFNKFQSANPELLKAAETFTAIDSDASAISLAGDLLFVKLYGGTSGQTLTAVRHLKYQEMLAAGSQIDPTKLPPTIRAAHYASLRVHLQVVRWVSLNEEAKCAINWGWQMTTHGLMPIYTDVESAPDSVLKFIRCKCKSETRRCQTNTCSCRKYNLKCVEACGGCHGRDCGNMERIDMQE